MEGPAATTTVLVICCPIAGPDVAARCQHICSLLEYTGARVALCDVRNVTADAVTVDALARLRVAARRQGCHVRLRHVSAELGELLAYMGLLEVLTG